MKYKLFDVIVLNEDILEHNLKAGMVGAIVDIYSEPEDAYEVEFCDKDGQTICMLPLYHYQILALE
ncbi:hypothetical protein M2263_001659 [Providencia alcalifaciens]|nr:hypothetical protein [Providencia alcalifaciens]